MLALTRRELKPIKEPPFASGPAKNLQVLLLRKGGVVSVEEVQYNYIRKSQQKVERAEARECSLEATRQEKNVAQSKVIAKRFGLVWENAIEWSNERQQLILKSFIRKQ